jgi:site-specific DNA-methyltransferase (adenine-specific)
LVQRARSTATSNFGVSRRESHDSTAFYGRFTPPVISSDAHVNPPRAESIDQIFAKDARRMREDIADASVALVVTSPPYFAGKEYEEALGEGDVPSDYFEYLQLLYEVFRECKEVLEPGGRIAVNVANLGRKPYRSLSADVIEILQDRLGLLLRGEIVWVKGKGAGNSTAWGSFQSAANPVLRDLTERVIVASKGRFDRAIPRRERAKEDPRLPSEVSIYKDEFMEATVDLWEIPPESATRVGHPAPFPVELPQRLIELYTYRGDLVLDPFMGSGSAAVAAVRTERHFVGYDLDQRYRDIALRRVEDERDRLGRLDEYERERVVLPAVPQRGPDDEDPQSRAVREGRAARELASALLEAAGFTIVKEDQRFSCGVEVNFVATDNAGRQWFFDVSGAFTSTRGGLRRTDTLWKALGKAAILKATHSGDYELIFLTTDLPEPGTSGDAALKAARKDRLCLAALEMRNPEDQRRLKEYALGGSRVPHVGPSSQEDLEAGALEGDEPG